ncbi:hypothetical protein KI387_002507, partial [Taxus chinensis]
RPSFISPPPKKKEPRFRSLLKPACCHLLSLVLARMPDPSGPDQGSLLSGSLSPNPPDAWTKIVEGSTSSPSSEKLSPSLSDGSFSLRIPSHITEAAAASRDLSL